MSYESIRRWIREIPEHLKTPEMCNEAVTQSSYTLRHVPNHLKTQKMCDEVVSNTQQYFFLFLIVLKHKTYVSRPLKSTHGSWTMSLIILI